MPNQRKQRAPHTKRQMERRRATLRPHPMRVQIVDVMHSYRKPISPTQLARITGGSPGSVSYHVRVLVSAGVVELAEVRRARASVELFYALVRDEQKAQLNDPVGLLLALCGALTVPGVDDGFPQPVTIDSAAREELREVIERLQPKVRAIASTSTARAG